MKQVNQYPIQTVTVSFESPRAVNIGDVFYMIRKTDHQTFREPCRVCKGEKTLTINGVTFRCPCCDNEKEMLRLNGYTVKRFRVYKITDEVRSDEWKPSTNHNIKIELYHKVGHGYQCADYSTTTITETNLCKYLNLPFDDKLKMFLDFLIYDDYRLAVEVAEKMKAQALQTLKEHNEFHGSNHVAVFETEHDKKSN